jgi:hypothetical protein
MYTFNWILFKILVVFIFYDGIFDNFLYDDFSLIKIFVIGYLFCVAIVEQCRNFYVKVLGFEIVLFYVYHSAVGLISLPFALSPTASFEFCCMYQLPVAIYSFYYFENLTRVSYNRLLTFFVKVAVSFAVVNTVLYFVDIPIWERAHKWIGRISCSYPTSDVAILSYALVTLLFFDGINLSSSKRLLFTSIVFLCIVFQFSGTGVVLLICIIFACIIAVFFRFSPIIKTHIKRFLFLIPISMGIGYITLKEYYPDLFETSILVLENRVSILLGESPNIDTVKLREDQYESSLSYQTTIVQKIFGIGLGRATFDSEYIRNPNYIFIENQYSFNKICYGYIGNLLFVTLLLVFFLKSLTMKQITIQQRMFFCFGSVIFAISSNTIVPLCGFGTADSLALFYAMFTRMRTNRFYIKNDCC